MTGVPHCSKNYYNVTSVIERLVLEDHPLTSFRLCALETSPDRTTWRTASKLNPVLPNYDGRWDKEKQESDWNTYTLCLILEGCDRRSQGNGFVFILPVYICDKWVVSFLFFPLFEVNWIFIRKRFKKGLLNIKTHTQVYIYVYTHTTIKQIFRILFEDSQRNATS